MNDIPYGVEFPLPSDITPAPDAPPLELDIIRSGTAEITQAADTYHHPLIVASEGRGAAGNGDAGVEPQAAADDDQERPVEEPAVVPPEAGVNDGPVDPPEDPPFIGAAESPDDPAARVRALLVRRIATVHESEALLGRPESPYYVVSPDGVTRPKDQLTGEVIRPGEIPPSLLADENLRRGIGFLQEHGEELNLRILLVGSGERDALPASGVQLHAEARAVQTQGGSLYIEGIASKEMEQLLRGIYERATQATGREAMVFQRQLRAAMFDHPNLTHDLLVAEQLIGTGVRVRQVDFTTDGAGADRILADQYRQLRSLETGRQDVSSLVQYKRLQASFMHYRDSYLIAKVGGDLAQQHARAGVFPTRNTLLVSKVNENIGQRLQGFGASVSVAGSPEQHASRRNLLRTVAAGEIHPDDYINLIDL